VTARSAQSRSSSRKRDAAHPATPPEAALLTSPTLLSTTPLAACDLISHHPTDALLISVRCRLSNNIVLGRGIAVEPARPNDQRRIEAKPE
jgi:hypothetical protein